MIGRSDKSRITRSRLAHWPSATFGVPSGSEPSAWISRRFARSIGSTTSPVRSSIRSAGSGSDKLPVAVHATGPRRLAQQLTRPLGQEVPQRGEPVWLVDVQPQEPRVRDRVLAAVRPGPRRDADERLLARPAVEPLERVLAADDPLGVLEQPLEPAAVLPPAPPGR